MVEIRKPFGLRPVTTLGSSSSARMNRYKKAVGTTASNRLVVGDLVALNADGEVLRVSTSTGANNGRIIGVVAGFLNANLIPDVFAKPASSGKIALSAVAGYVLVYDDPDQIFQVNTQTSAIYTALAVSGAGKNVDVVTTENQYDLVLGRSGQTVNGAAVSAASTHAVVIGAGTALDPEGKVGTVYVKLKNHVLA